LIQVAITSIWDVRLGAPLGVVLGLLPLHSFALSILSSTIVLVPFMYGFRRFVDWSEKHFPSSLALLHRFTQRHQDKIARYGYWGVFLFVALPLPGTGPWMGALACGLLRMRPAPAALWLTAGIALSGLLTLGLAEGVLSIIPWFTR